MKKTFYPIIAIALIITTTLPKLVHAQVAEYTCEWEGMKKPGQTQYSGWRTGEKLHLKISGKSMTYGTIVYFHKSDLVINGVKRSTYSSSDNINQAMFYTTKPRPTLEVINEAFSLAGFCVPR